MNTILIIVALNMTVIVNTGISRHPKWIQTITLSEEIRRHVNKGISIHITKLLFHWTKVLDGMLFCGPLPL